MEGIDKMSKPVIVIYKGQSQYNVLRSFADDIAEGFNEYGYETAIIDLSQSNFADDLMTILNKKNVMCFFSFNGMGIDIATNDGKSLYDQLGIPFFAFFVDHPFYHAGRMNAHPNSLTGAKRQIFSFLDRKQVEFANRHVESQSAKIFMPHAASHFNAKNIPVKPLQERGTEVFMPGSYSDPDSHRNVWQQWGPIMAELMEQLLEDALANPEQTLEYSFNEVLYRKGMASDTLYTDKTFEFLRVADSYLRSKYRHELVCELQEFNLHVTGNGWENFKGNKGKMRISPAMSYESMIKEMQNSKIVINAFPTYGQHSHERVFDAGASGAVVFTASSPYFRECFGLERHVQYFDPFESRSGAVREILGSLSDVQGSVDAGREFVLNHHQWKHRAGSILEHVFIHTNLVQQR